MRSPTLSSNIEVLDAIKEVCEPASEVSYCNVWFNGCLTNIRNGDHFCYIESDVLEKIPEALQVGEYHTCVFKPRAQITCKRCGKEGHHASDSKCPMCTPPELENSIEVFWGGKFHLSNLPKCPEGCIITEGNKVFPSSEHKYQFAKLKAHDKIEEAFDLLEEPDPFKVMQKAKEVVPDSEESPEWKEALSEMAEANTQKYHACAHARLILVNSRLTIAEATSDKFWGTGMTLEQTNQCLPEFWPGQNNMGKILMEVCTLFQNEEGESGKQKAQSPLVHEVSKKSEHG